MYASRKKYLVTGGAVPRSTQYRHKKRQQIERVIVVYPGNWKLKYYLLMVFCYLPL